MAQTMTIPFDSGSRSRILLDNGRKCRHVAGGRASAKMAVFCNKKIMPVEEAEIAQR
jgi:hypothetical protein